MGAWGWRRSSRSKENLENVITDEACLGLRSKCHNNVQGYALTWLHVNLNPFIWNRESLREPDFQTEHLDLGEEK